MSKQNISRVEEAIDYVQSTFPFKGYIRPGRGAHSNVANHVLRYLEPGSTILDFGSGPCDKTAVLQRLGYKCSAYDDLQDEWHTLSDNRQKIIDFTARCGIDFKLGGGGPLPFDKESFDMVMVHDVLEHLHDSPRDLLNDLLELAKPGGFLFVTVPNAVNIRKRLDVLIGKTNLPPYSGFYWYPGKWRGHIREYVKDDLLKLSQYLNLEIAEVKACDHMLEKLPTKAVPIYLLVTKVFDGWKDSWLLIAKKKPNWAPKKNLSRAELNDILRVATPYAHGE